MRHHWYLSLSLSLSLCSHHRIVYYAARTNTVSWLTLILYETLKHAACEHDQDKIVHLLIETYNVNVNASAKQRRSPLHRGILSLLTFVFPFSGVY